MVRRFIIFHGVWLLVTGVIICLLFMWTFDATKLSPEYFAKPWRAWFRFIFTLIMSGLLIGTQIVVAQKYPNS